MPDLNTIIKKLSIILALCGSIAILLYTTDLGALFNGKAKEKVKEIKKEVEEKIEAKKEEVEEKIEEKKEEVKEKIKKVEDKVESNIEKVEEKVKELKNLKLKDILK